MTFAELYGDRMDDVLGTTDRTQRFTTAKRKAYVNEAMRWFNEETGCFVKRAEIALTDGTAEYNVESTSVITAGDYLRPAKVSATLRQYDGSGAEVTDYRYVEGPDLPYRSEEALNQERPNWRAESAGTPECWTFRADGAALHIVLVPAPSVPDGETWTLYWPYVAQPADMSADDDEPYQVSGAARTSLRPYHRGILHYGAGLLEQLRKNIEAVDRHFKIAAGYVTKYRGDQTTPTGNTMRLRQDFRQRLRQRRPLDPMVFP